MEADILKEFKTLGFLIVLSSIMLSIGLCYLMIISKDLENVRKDIAKLKEELSEEEDKMMKKPEFAEM